MELDSSQELVNLSQSILCLQQSVLCLIPLARGYTDEHNEKA